MGLLGRSEKVLDIFVRERVGTPVTEIDDDEVYDLARLQSRC